MKRFVLDIETIADPNLSDALRLAIFSGLKPDARLTDPEKIERDVLTKQLKAESEFALSPMTAAVCCISLKDYETGEERSFYGGNEQILIGGFAHFADEHFPLNLITFNGKQFDIPVLRTRMAKYGVGGYPLPNKKFDQLSHFDIRQFLANGDDYGKGTLSQWALFFGVALPDEIVVANEIQELYNTGQFEKIHYKCISDVRMTANIAKAIERFNE